MNQYSEDDYDLEYNRFILNRNEIFRAAEDMKKEFLEADEVDLQVRFYYDNENEPMLIDLEMDERQFYKIISSDIAKTVNLTERVLKETKEREDISKVDQVVLAGGSSQIRLVQEMLYENEELRDLVNGAEEASTLIARGAARLASIELQVEERTRFEIGTRVIHGRQLNLYEPIIAMGEKLPCSGTHTYYLSRADQDEVTVEYYEKDIKNYPQASKIDDEGINLVNELTVSGIPKQPDLAVKVTFSIESDGTPSITAEIIDKNGNVVKADSLSVVKGGNLY